MATVRDPTNPRGTKWPNKDPILVSIHIFWLITVIERFCKIHLSLKIYTNNIYGIFSLFFSDEVLTIIIKNINIYRARHYRYLKTI